ncbi:cation diffusion facilitator family transporter [Candidiatus Paracoxiella cheracis]|uniref:cation diffusion facilitator family transporter n=1 Tax=Candidiatus Paracoxiella cheracis TaxID=3405120 RepID=UPI003BF4C151
MLAIVLTLGFAGIEAIGGWWARSLTLLGDAGHMASDSVTLTIAAIAAWVALRPPSSKHTYGLGRAEVLAAWVSSVIMLVISVAVVVEAIRRLHTPMQVNGIPVMVIAAIGVAINLLVAWLLTRSERTLNVQAALLHVLGDLLGSLAAFTSGVIIYFTGWLRIDPILSIFIGILIMISSLRLLRETMTVLMEGVPQHLNIRQVSQHLSQLDGVKAIHDLHIWTLSSGKIALSAHVDVKNITMWENVFSEMKMVLKSEYNINHITLQPEQNITDCEACTNRNLS